MPKKAKKGKKKKSEAGPEIRTTQEILNERAKMFCPRLGDSYTRTIKVEHILQVLNCASVKLTFNFLKGRCV